MAAGLDDVQKRFAREVFQELLRTRRQVDLATELGCDQSRVSKAARDGSVSSSLLYRAARLAGRSRSEIDRALGVGEEDAHSEELSPFEAARQFFLVQEAGEGRGAEARAFLAERQVSFAGAERKSARWWLETLSEEFREWRGARAT